MNIVNINDFNINVTKKEARRLIKEYELPKTSNYDDEDYSCGCWSQGAYWDGGYYYIHLNS